MLIQTQRGHEIIGDGHQMQRFAVLHTPLDNPTKNMNLSSCSGFSTGRGTVPQRGSERGAATPSGWILCEMM